MDEVLEPEVLQFTTVYVNNLLITSVNWEEHYDCIMQTIWQPCNSKTWQITIYSRGSVVLRICIISVKNILFTRENLSYSMIFQEHQTVTIIFWSV